MEVEVDTDAGSVTRDHVTMTHAVLIVGVRRVTMTHADSCMLWGVSYRDSRTEAAQFYNFRLDRLRHIDALMSCSSEQWYADCLEVFACQRRSHKIHSPGWRLQTFWQLWLTDRCYVSSTASVVWYACLVPLTKWCDAVLKTAQTENNRLMCSMRHLFMFWFSHTVAFVQNLVQPYSCICTESGSPIPLHFVHNIIVRWICLMKLLYLQNVCVETCRMYSLLHAWWTTSTLQGIKWCVSKLWKV